MFRTRHLSDDALLLASEEALPRWRLSWARRHLGTCADCSRRRAQLQRTLGEFADAWGGLVPQLPDGSGARARLRTQMARAIAADDAPSWGSAVWGASLQGERIWLASCAAAGLVLAVFLWVGADAPGSPATQASSAVFLRPNPQLTPGSTMPVALEDLCAPDTPRVAQPIPAAVQHRVFASYGADPARADAYELDHLVTPELGGASATENLWPQPFQGTAWNAYVKDELEQLFHQRVCAGTMTLRQAQQELSGDWIAAYKHHFATPVPLRDYAESPLTAADGPARRPA